MSEQTVIDTVRDEISTVPTRSGDLESVIRSGRRRRLIHRVGASSGAVAITALIIGLALTIGQSSSPVASDGTLQLVSDFSVPVFDSHVESEGALVYQGKPGPTSTGIDTDELGTEIVVKGNAVEAFVVPVSDNPRNALQADRIIYLGDLEGSQLALHPFERDVCVFLGNYTQVTGGGGCVTQDGLVGGISVDPPVGSWLAWTRLPESAAVVVAESEDGTRFWQQVVGRTVVFILPDGTPIDPSTLSALNADGREVAATRDADLDLGEIGFPPGTRIGALTVPTIECPPDSIEGPKPEGC